MSSTGSAEFWTKIGAIAGVIGTIAGVLFGVSQCNAQSRNPTGTAVLPTPAPPAVALPAPAPTQPSTPREDPASPNQLPPVQPTEPADVTEAPQGLGDVISNEPCGNFGWGNVGPAQIAGEEHAAAFPISCFNNGEQSSADFVVPPGAKQLTGAVGINDKTENSDSSATFTVLDPSGNPLATAVGVPYGRDAPISADLNGVVRVRLQVDFRMKHSGLVRACWADMQFRF